MKIKDDYLDNRTLPIGFRILLAARAIIFSWYLIWEFKALQGKRATKSNLATTLLNDITNSSSGKFNEWIQKIIKTIRKNQTRAFDESFSNLKKLSLKSFENFDNQNSNLCLELKQNGFIKIENLLNEDDASSLYSQLLEIECQSDDGRPYSNLKLWLNSNTLEPRVFTNQEKLTKLPIIEKFQKNIKLLDIARRYLETEPILAATQSWTTKKVTSITEDVLSKSALAFHSDADYFKFFKVFLLLTNVSELNGPFMFVKSSHRGPRQVTGRLHDSKIKKYGGEILVGTGKPGDVILADTSGWHKGSIVEQSSRTMVQLLFTSSLFGHPTI